MGKLFVSLYAYIIISIFILSGALEKLWPEPNGIDALPLAPQVTESLSQLAKTANGITKLKDIYQNEVISSDLVAFLPEQSADLKQGLAVPVFDGPQQVIWYLRVNDKELLKIGPYRFDVNSYDSVWPFFIMLLVIGLPVAAWSYWLWRDFNQLEKACHNISAPEDLQISGDDKSALLPIKQTLMAMKARIKHLLDSQRELTSSVSHEFRTPLARLKFAIAMLEQTQSDDKSKPYFDGMQSDIQELESLVSEMLEFAKLEREKPQLNIELYDVVAQTQHFVQKLGFNHAAAIKIEANTAIELNADPHFIGRAIQNFIGNALKYAEQQVIVTLTQTSNTIFIKVADDGPGIEQSEWENVFKPFTRLDKSRNKKIKGFGLGLAIVQKIINWHEGECYLESGPLKGACFVIALPKKP
ncbi:ATP-binding protein [Pseudoalteromonas sp. MMG024]|uniref:ATP-binding protein n=1 Tax=Pseudoalteromonas sp. MMG024 TaxID=2909980 RepID=UPI001F47EED4|nr:ATP-binding protein [Pseudoalteromonas sp. MMG024]MCF6457855.1 ATP-binding protein [Pseudoalteromonas sp. MMG024]